MCFSNSPRKALKSKAEVDRSITWNCLGLLGFLSTHHPGSSTNLHCCICRQVCIFSILRSLVLYNTPEFPWSQSLTCWHLIILILHSTFLLARLSHWSAALLHCHMDCFNDLERKMYNNTRRVCNEVRKMYKEIKVMQTPPGWERTWQSLGRHSSVVQWRGISVARESQGDENK